MAPRLTDTIIVVIIISYHLLTFPPIKQTHIEWASEHVFWTVDLWSQLKICLWKIGKIFVYVQYKIGLLNWVTWLAVISTAASQEDGCVYNYVFM